jgi:hypothetical protein
MPDDIMPEPASEPARRAAPKKRAGRVKTGFIALIVGFTGGIATPLLIPDSAPDCVKPLRVVYDYTDGTSVQVDHAGDGENGCGVELKFVKPGRGDL